MIPKFNIEETVLLKTDIEKMPRLVISYRVTKGSIIYELSQGTIVSYHYDFEIEKPEQIEKQSAGFKH